MSAPQELFGNLLVGVVGNNCIVIAAEKYGTDETSICSLNGQITVAWSGHKDNSLKIVDKAKVFTNSMYGKNSPTIHVADFLIDPEIRMLNNLPTLPYTESFMVASCDGEGRYLYVTDSYGTISHVLASAMGRQSDLVSSVLRKNYSSAKKGILGTIDFALRTLCVIAKPDAELIEVSITAFKRPFEIVDKTIVSRCLSKIELSSVSN